MYTGLALTTLATLLLELALTRLFSVVFYYHFAFLAISLAMFGLGAGGVLSYWLAERPGTLFAKLGVLALTNAALALAALGFLLTRREEPAGLSLVLLYLVSALPFAGAGAVVSLVIGESISRVDRAYFFDLLGAAGGCVLLVPFLNLLGGPSTVIAAASFYAVTAAIWFNLAGSVSRRAIAVAATLALVGLATFNARAAWIDVQWSKGGAIPDEIFSRWNTFSRVGVSPEAPGRMHIVIDGDAATGIPPFDWAKLTDEDRRTLAAGGPGLVYRFRPGAKTLVIGAGGGWDVGRALAAGAKDITAVEINPLIADSIMRGKLSALSHNLYRRPELRIVVEDGRSFVRRSPEQYHIIQATLVDTWASTAAGAFALSENNLYTVEAFRDYLEHLTDDGVLSFTRWGFDPPRESLRLLALATEALAALGEREPWRHVIVARENAGQIAGWGAQDTVLISRRPLSDAESARLRAAAAPLQILAAPDLPPAGAFAEYLHAADRRAFERAYPFDIAPVHDDRPFFFYTVQTRDLWNYVASANRESADFKLNRAVPLLFGLFGVSVLATFLMLVLPAWLLGARLPAGQGVKRFLLYFVLLGAGYILVQVSLIQKFVLLLGHPTYALTVIVLVMLVASGAGSLFHRRFLAGTTRLPRALWVAALLIAMLGVVAPGIIGGAAGWPLPLKMALTALLIAPAAFVMGMPFPAGLSVLESRSAPAVRWAWSVNAAASVLGSVGAIFLAIHFGLRATLWTGGAMYVLAAVVLRWSGSR